MIMKTKTYLFFLAFLFALSFTVTTACSDDDNDDNDEMELQKESDDSDNVETELGDLEPELVCEELYCNRNGYKIYGKMYRKVSEGSKAPCVILSHSSSLTHAAMAGYAESIAEKGMSAYCFDFCGGSSESLSDGSTDEMTVFTEVDDLTAVLETVKKLPYVDADSIFLLGSSQGGLVSALTAEDVASDIRGMILFYPAFNIPELVRMFAGFGGGFGGTGGFGGFGGMTGMSEAYIESIKDFDVWSHIGGYAGPVLIIHGTNDFIVPISNSEKAVTIYPNASLVRIEGANHGFNSANLGGYGSMVGEYDDEVMPYVYSFLVSR